MQIKRLVIENFKSIERIELIEPNPFTVFVGPNGSGKSNIFEALEFVNLKRKVPKTLLISIFGGSENFLKRKHISNTFRFECQFSTFFSIETSSHIRKVEKPLGFTIADEVHNLEPLSDPDYQQFYENFTRLFVNNQRLEKFILSDDSRLSLSASNLEKVLKRLLANELLKAEIFEWLELFVPGFKAVEVDDRNELHWFEDSTSDYFTKDLISDGTYNILALLTAVYQSETPQFLCIEEPENGLNPKVVKELVSLCRYACEEFGHFIWLNTHSQSLVSALTPDEIILVDKVERATQVKQIKGMNLHGLPMDEAWLSKALGGGLPW